MISLLGGRKFFFAILTSVLVFVLTTLQMVTPEQFIKFLEFIGVSYIIGNVANKAVEKVK